MRIIISFTCLLIFFSCNQKHHSEEVIGKKYADIERLDTANYLLAVYKDPVPELGSSFAFINKKGDTIIPYGKYSHCWTDTFKTYAIVYDNTNTDSTTVAIDKNENILFDIVFYDNWPDEISEGLFRVKRSGKIGYANKWGQIVIPCKYQCAFPFENGRARVTYSCVEKKDDFEHITPQSNEWFYINRVGTTVK